MTDPAPPAEGQTFGASRSRAERRANRREARKRRQREWLLGGVVAVVLVAAIAVAVVMLLGDRETDPALARIGADGTVTEVRRG